MRIFQITPGTANFYCGHCIRDTALVRTMKRYGHEVMLQPLYLPMHSDEPNVEKEPRIFFGGLNCYLQQKFSFFRHTPRWLDEFFDAEPILRLLGKFSGMTRASDLGEMTLSMLKGEHGKQAKELEKLIDWFKTLPKPDLISLSNGLLLGMAPAFQHELGVPVVCTLQGEEGFMDDLPQPYRDECWEWFSKIAAQADGLVAVSRYYGEEMKRRLNLDGSNLHVVRNGITLDGFEPREFLPETPTLGYLARMCEFKGLDKLVDAFIDLKKRPHHHSLRLRVAGTVTGTDPEFVEDQKKKLEHAGVLGDAEFIENLSREDKVHFLQSLSVLSVPATYGESFGLYVVEAMAAGVPVVQPRHGGFPEILERAPGGVLFDEDNHEAYVEALDSLLSDPERIQELGRHGCDVVFEYFSVERMTNDVIDVYERVVQAHAAA